MANRKLTCIVCPMGCALEVNVEEKSVTGNTCKRGAIYGIEEVTHPTRVITSTVKVESEIIPMLPVKTEKPLPKELNFKCIEALKSIKVKAPIHVGDIIAKDILGTGVNIVATRTLLK